MKKTLKYISAIFLASAAAVSCGDRFLETEGPAYSDANFPATVEDVCQMVTGVYSSLYSAYNDCGAATWFVYSNIVSDEELGGGGGNDLDVQAMDRMLYNDRDFFAPFWRYCYEGINRANRVIDYIDNVTWDNNEDLRSQCLGEARFLHAYFYFMLTQMFGDVPLLTASYITEEMLPPASAEEVIYPYIISELEAARNLLPPTSYSGADPNCGHVTKYTAEALMARVAMFYWGFYKHITELVTAGGQQIQLVEFEGCYGGVRSTDDIVAALKDIVASGKFGLLEDFRSLWPYSNRALWDCTKENEWTPGKSYMYIADMDRENCFHENGDDDACTSREVLFSVRCNTTPGRTNNLTCLYGLRQPGADGIFPANTGQGYGTVNPGLWDMWTQAENNQSMSYTDIRKLGSIFDLRDELAGYTFGYDNAMEEAGYAQKKIQTIQSYIGDKLFLNAMSSGYYYGDGTTDLGLRNNPTDIILLRYSDVLLMITELTGDPSYMNQVQRRSGVPETAYSLKAMQDERLWEFACEGIRWTDMRRWSGNEGEANCYCAKSLQNNQSGKYIYNMGQKEVHKYNYAERYVQTDGFLDYPESVVTASDGRIQHKESWGASAYFDRCR
ncbi:MAG: RagB/SusD family nutrient uptake outer membrane protein [Bacteroidales bacterium]|nr:RagB/SusD family nutrient uptake outer membrane protein [Bacteroidales bacterium]